MQLRTVNKTLSQYGIKAKLYNNRSYFYFWGDDVEAAPTTSVYVPRLNDLTLDQWMMYAQEFVQLSRNRMEEISLRDH